MIYQFFLKLFFIPKLFNLIFICGMPKSGSTFLRKTMEEITGYKARNWLLYGGRREQEIDFLAIMFNSFGNKIITQHIIGHEFSLKIFKAYNIKPIVTLRSIFDIVISTRDHFLKESCELSQAYIEKNEFSKLSKEKQYDLIIDLVVPWHINFFISWKKSKEQYKNILFVNFEDLTLKKEKTINRILKHLGLNYPQEKIINIIKKTSGSKGTRFNKGLSGRGFKELNKNQIERIKRFASYYPEIDFTDIGITNQ
ncbi:hypothetical protein C0585_07615 [Candidatus Woesearchaeota archaeon]|nr:MAG: hypothetical protein C0585_07615 [Candidatus Woesearchaeota archaeon]